MEILLQTYEHADDSLFPQTLGGLIDILIEERAINDKHNNDKVIIKSLQK